MNNVTLSDKKEFLRWFLRNFKCKMKDSFYLLNYLMLNETLLTRVHFTNQLEQLPKTIMISTTCVPMTSFQFVKQDHVSYDVGTAFHDIRLNPEEDVFIGLFFKNWKSSPQYASVLEENPMNDHNVSQPHIVSLLAEMTLDHILRKQKEKQLYEEIDRALENGDQSRFLQLTGELNRLKDYEIH
ncbi:MAG: YpiB family protein [Bacillaceae bacterium]|nr:YpiB family protein [Bacillaceae bacterium]